MSNPRRHRLSVAVCLGLALLAPASQALTFQLRDVSTSGSLTAEQLAGFQTAANYWSGKLTDNVTVYLDVAFNNLPAHVLGGTSTSTTNVSFNGVRNRLTADISSAADSTAVASLQAGSSLSFMATQGDLTSRLDNDGSVNNQLLVLTSANAKALGLSTITNATNADALIEFGSFFASSFSYSRSGGVPVGKIDFISVAQHEIGHALGFVSGVDDIDYCAGPANNCAQFGVGTGVNRFENDAWYSPLDLFRYSAPGVLDLRVGGSPYLSLNGGVTSVEGFSTGQFNGNGYQASHFLPGSTGLMRPAIATGVAIDASLADLTALDVIGWNLATAVPEPGSTALMLAGLAGLGLAVRRRSNPA